MYAFFHLSVEIVVFWLDTECLKAWEGWRNVRLTLSDKHYFHRDGLRLVTDNEHKYIEICGIHRKLLAIIYVVEWRTKCTSGVVLLLPLVHDCFLYCLYIYVNISHETAVSIHYLTLFLSVWITLMPFFCLLEVAAKEFCSTARPSNIYGFLAIDSTEVDFRTSDIDPSLSLKCMWVS